MLDSKLGYIQQQNNNIFGIYVIAENGGIYRSTFHTVRNEYMNEQSWYSETLNSTSPIWFEPHYGSYVGQSTDVPLISVGINILDKSSSNSLGIVLVEIELSSIQYIYDKGLLQNGYSFLLNEDKNPIVFPDTMGAYNEGYYSDIIENRPTNYMYVNKESSESTFSTISVVSYGNIYRDGVHILLIVIFLTILLSIVTIFIANKMSLNISKPITELTHLMSHAKTGNLDVQMKVITNDEIGILSHRFNEMITEINHYTLKEIDDLKKLQKSELKMLQAQINPHFLYNTLDSVIWMSRTGNTDDVVTMVTALTQFFRISLSKGADVITLDKEFQHLNSYLTIQSMRYSSILTYEANLPEEYYSYRIPKLLLQPLIENAIYHGIKSIDEPGKITITLDDDDKNIYIYIHDTGLGMDVDKLKKINKICRTTQGKELNSYGVINVCRRMQIMFGHEYYLRYSSTPEQGTTVTVPIPKIWKENQNND